MVRAFERTPVDPGVLDRILDLSRRTPSAGHTQGTDLLVLDDVAAVTRYWDLTLPEPRRGGFRWPGLLDAPVLVLVVAHPGSYVARYAEPDKAATGLGRGEAAWPVPYWWVDAGAVVEHLLLATVDAGLGACFFGLFGHERLVADGFGVPADRRVVGTVALGHPLPDEPGRSADRARRGVDEVVHRNGW